MSGKPWERTEWLDEDRLLLVESVENIIGRAWSFEHLAGTESQSNGWSNEAWQALGASGMLGLGGDNGGSTLDAALVGLACGRALAIVPIVETAAALALLRNSPTSGAATLAEAIRAGEVVAVLIDGTSAAGRASAEEQLVPFGGVATTFIVRDGDKYLAVAQEAGSSSRVAPAMGPTPMAQVKLADAEAVDLEIDDATVAAHDARVAGAFARSALAVGGCIGAIDTAVDYVQDRRQFGVPIGTFQAVQHELADAAIATELARTALLSAASSSVLEPGDVSRAQRMAFAAYLEVGRTVCQVRGGYGFSVEFDGQAHFRMAKTLAVLADRTELSGTDPLDQIRTDAANVLI